MNARFYKGMTAVAIAATMALGGAVPALATTAQDVYYGITYNKSGEGIRPTETLTFTQTKVSASGSSVYAADGSNLPPLTISPITLSEAVTTGNVKVAIPEYQTVGVFTYKLTPSWNTDNTKTDAGVDYDDINEVYVVVTVTNGANGLESTVHFHQGTADSSDKTAFDTFTYNSGKVSVSKTVTGNLGDKNEYFNVTVHLTGEAGKNYAGSYTISGGSATDNPKTIAVGGSAEVKVKNGDTITINGLPAGVTYTVTEDNYTAEGYDAASYEYSDTADTKTISANDADTVTITNRKQNDNIDTGVFLNNAPYIAILAGVGAAAIIVINRRRHANDED